MRLWSLHPKYLDSARLLALWGQGLLARKILLGKIKSNRNYPQLIRFRKHPTPVTAIDAYLYEVWLESQRRGYNFQSAKIRAVDLHEEIKVADKQLAYELLHLRQKLKAWDIEQHERIKDVSQPLPHPLFKVVKGEIEDWEKPKY